MKTRVYSEGIVEEAVYLLAEWLASPALQGSIAFPEIVVPVLVLLRKSVKNTKTGFSSGKDSSLVKNLLERIDESAKWVEKRRAGVHFSPGKMDALEGWENDLKPEVDDSPLGKYIKIQRKTREKRRKLVEKVRVPGVTRIPPPTRHWEILTMRRQQARQGEDEILEED